MPAFRLLKDVAHCFVDMCIADNSLLDKRCAENGDIFFIAALWTMWIMRIIFLELRSCFIADLEIQVKCGV